MRTSLWQHKDLPDRPVGRVPLGSRILLATSLALPLTLVLANSLGPIRDRVTLPDASGALFEVLIHGGAPDAAGILRGAGVAVRGADGRILWDAFERTWHPCLLRQGRFAGQPVVLIGVRKPTRFDPVERLRPFIYALSPGGKGLRKVWLGTSLSRPFVDLDFGNLDGKGEDELVALERTASGGLALGAYRWEGFGVEGIARSNEIPDAREVRCGNVWGDEAEEAVVCSTTEDTWQFGAWSIEGERLLTTAQAMDTVGPPGAHWEIVGKTTGDPGGVLIATGAAQRRIRFADMRP